MSQAAMNLTMAKPGDRVARLRNRIIDAPREACIERARYLTQSMKEHWDEPALTRMSLAFEHILSNITTVIRDDELIVGCRTSKLKGAPFFPENKSRWIEGDADAFEQRVLQKVLLPESERQDLVEQILPFWAGRTVEDRLNSLCPEDVAEDMDKYIFTMVLEITYGIGHFTMNHRRILKTGLSGVIAQATERMNALSDEDRSSDKGCFYDAAIRSAKAVIGFANRYADLAETMAVDETDPVRARELAEIAEVCRRVPEHPAATFREAIQCVYFIHLAAQIESGGNSISLGRIDQVLATYYEADLRAGAITADKARELLSLLFIKTNEIWNILEEAFIPGGEGTEGKTTQNVTVGGVGENGKDATCELSRLGMEAFAEVRTVQPNFGVRISPDAPDEFFLQAARFAKEGVPLHLFNDEAVISSLVQAGHSIEDARDYGVVGCLEPSAQGKSFASTFAVQFSGIKCLELALSDGVDNIFGYQSGISTGDPVSFETFDDLWTAYDKQSRHFMNQMVRGMAVLDQAISDLVPSPFASAMIDGPLDKGVDLTRGGAIYNSTGVQMIGFANVADSLTAVKKAVYEDRTLTMERLAELLSEDWEDGEKERAYLENKVPKYGNNDPLADDMAARVFDHFCRVVGEHENFRGGRFWPGIFSVGFHIAMGAFAGASPDGRQSGDILANGITPSNGRAVNGPTAILNSVARLPLESAFNGTNLNMRFHPTRLQPEALMTLMKTYFSQGGVQTQFNMIDSDTLRAAQADPDAYRDLVVRVSGYSALFTGLSEIAQAEMIQRIEYDC
jgi:pyruvate formate-lyase/glycerol dehydratase family glycyl radical enzyme